ncbi:MAG TPA: oligosaccharide flippase family protein, partial [Spirochaetota bacterium]|nr:oligosaccharide flippase family protein [Spirochaetota bacterium]
MLLTQNKTFQLAKYNVISSVLMVALTITGTVITRTYHGPLLAQIYFPLFLLPVVIWLSFKYIPGKASWPDVTSMKEMLKYAVPLGVAGILATLMLQTNQMVVSAMCSPEEFANYVNGAIEIPLIGVITGSIASVILVDMTDYVHKGENSKALELFKLSSVKSAGILFPVMFFLLGA